MYPFIHSFSGIPGKKCEKCKMQVSINNVYFINSSLAFSKEIPNNTVNISLGEISDSTHIYFCKKISWEF